MLSGRKSKNTKTKNQRLINHCDGKLNFDLDKICCLEKNQDQLGVDINYQKILYSKLVDDNDDLQPQSKGIVHYNIWIEDYRGRKWEIFAFDN